MQFNKVIIAVDFSAASLAAARWVAMQLAPRAELLLVHVVREPPAPSFVRPHLPRLEEMLADVTPGLDGALRGLAGVVGDRRTSIKLLIGTPADALAAFAHETGADLICLGRRRQRRGAARFGDTTAQRLLAQTRTPVLVVPTARPSLPARILVAVDDQRDCSANLRAACVLAQAYEAELELLHVLAPELPRLIAPGEVESLTHDWLASQLREVSNGARRVTTHVRVGDPGEQIVSFVHAAGADLALIGRGSDEQIGASTAPGDALPLGSTSRLVLWASPCPVLVLPPAVRTAEPEPARLDLRRRQIDSADLWRPVTTRTSHIATTELHDTHAPGWRTT